MPRILVQVLNHNGLAYMEDCFSSLRKADPQGHSVETLVVDNASADGSLAFLRERFPEVRVIENPENAGFAGGNNVGLRFAMENGFDYVYLLNQDTEVDPGFLPPALRVAESDPSIAAVQSKILLHHDKKRINTVGNEIHFLGFGFSGGCGRLDKPGEVVEGAEEPRKDITYPSGAGVLLRVSALREVGLFHEELFLYQEDLDLGWRLRLAGLRIVLAPRSVVYHKYQFSRNPRKFFHLERNRYLVMFQNYRIGTLLVLAPALAAMQIGMCFYAAAHSLLGQEKDIFAYFCRRASWRILLDARRKVQRTRRVKDRDVLRHFLGKLEFEDLGSPVLKHIANPLFNIYWLLVRKWIFW